MRDILLRISTLDLEHLILFAEIGLAASEDFNDIDNEVWQCNPIYADRTKKITKELKDLIKHELIMDFMGE